MPKGDLRRRINATTYRALFWGQTRVPPGMRSLIGFIFMVGGVFGFLPILGFWMFPLGVAFVALDVPFARDRIDAWMGRLADHAGLSHVPLAERQRGDATAQEPRQEADEDPTSSQ